MMITKKTKLWQYFSFLFVSIDQFGNALAGGNADNTISARVGYYNHHYQFERGKVPWYWSWFERVINTTFYPVDGPHHCHEAYHNDAGEIFDNRITNVMVAFAATLIIIPSCLIIAFVLYLLAALRIVKRREINRGENLEKRLVRCQLLLRSTLQELEEHEIDFDPKDHKENVALIKAEIENIKAVLGLG